MIDPAILCYIESRHKPRSMKNLLKSKRKDGIKVKLIVGTVATVFTFILIGTAILKINKWSISHRIVARAPVEVRLQKPITVEDIVPEVIVEKYVLDFPEPIDTPLEKYICEKFGAYDCKTALAVFTAESGLREDAMHINTNNTIDYGIAQINSVHFDKPGCSMKELVDQYKNVDCAYTIWLDQGFNPWVGFTNGNFKTHL